MKTYKIIANPSSGREQGLQVVQDLVALFSKDEVRLDILFTQKEGDGTRFARQEGEEDLLIAIGGDGTVNEVVNGLYERTRPLPLAIFPCGTVNDLGQYLDLPSDSGEFYQMIKKQKTLKADLGKAADRIFINVAAGGLFSEVAYSVPDKNKSLLGRKAYYLEGARSFLTNRKEMEGFPLDITSPEGHFSTEAVLFIVANTRRVGGFENLVPEAEIHDGQLDVLIIKEIDMGNILELLRDLGRGKHVENQHVIYFKTPWVQLESSQDLALDLDGEYAGKLPVKIEIIPEAIDLVVK
ncbi:MAG: diacylglycerol kinase family lipid kinase [Tissierellia bacterium]|nr:diacylglycerol kinase family lipid kinase [Tissierellia bacterium]